MTPEERARIITALNELLADIAVMQKQAFGLAQRLAADDEARVQPEPGSFRPPRQEPWPEPGPDEHGNGGGDLDPSST